MYKKIDKIVAKISEMALVLIIVIGLSMLLLTLSSVFYRYVLEESLKWGEEVLKMMLVWFGLLSVGVIAYKREHVGIVVFKEKMPKGVQDLFTLLSQIFVLIISVVMVVVGLEFLFQSGSQLTPALRIPYAWGYAAVPVSFLLMVFYEIRNTMLAIQVYKNRDLQVSEGEEDA